MKRPCRSFCVLNVVASLLSILPAVAHATCSPGCLGGSGAVMLAYLQQSDAACILTQQWMDEICDSMRSNAVNPIQSELEVYPSSLLSMGSEFTLEWAAEQIENRRITVVATHGGVGAVMLEMAPTPADAQSRANAYINQGIYGSGQVAFGGPVVPAPDLASGVFFTPLGISNNLKPDPCGFVYADYCASWDSNSDWACAAFIGSAHATPFCVSLQPALVDVFNKLECTPGNNGDLTIGSALPPNSPHRTNPSLLLRSRGDNLALDCNGCAGLAAHFDRCGAFRDTVWGVVGHDGTSQLRIRGYKSFSDWPFGGDVVRDLTPKAITGLGFYTESGIDRKKYPVLAFEEIGYDGRQFLSEAFEWTSKPKDWQELTRLNDAPAVIAKAGDPFVQEVWLGEDNKILTERPQSRITDTNPYIGAEAGLYAVAGQTDAFFAIEQATLLMLSSSCTSCEPTWTSAEIRLFTGDGSVTSQQQAADTLKQGNADYNAWCAAHPGQCTKLYPEKPVFGILGDPFVTPVNHGTFTDPEMCSTACFDPGQSANLGGDPLEDLPIYWVPARSTTEMTRLNGSAYRYHFPVYLPGERRYEGLIFLGDRRNLTGEPLQDPENVATTWENVLHAMGEPVYTILKSSDFPPSGAGVAKRDALVAEVNNGVSTLVGFEGSLITEGWDWAGDFFWNTTTPPITNDWDQLMTRPQSLIAILFGCNMGHLTRYGGAQRFIMRDALFASSTKTAVSFAVASGQSMDLHNYLWANVLATELQDAPGGTPWPVIVFNAKNRALAQYPFMLRTLRTIVSLGTMVRKHAQSTTDVQPWEGENAEPIGSAAVLRAFGGPGARPRVEVSLPRSDDVTLAVYDARGRIVTIMWDGRMDVGRRAITWDGLERDGRRARSGVYFVRLLTRNSGTASTKVVVLR